MDFTIKIYIELLDELLKAGYNFQTFSEFLENPAKKVILLRHDVEARYENSLELAQIQKKLNIRGTYYFRLQPKHYDLQIIEKIHDLGHETGYHYDDLSFCKGNYTQAIERFEKNLKILRSVVPVSTVCMEGAPRSKFDNRDLWTQYNLRDFEIKNEPYFDLDFQNVLYLTDTGRRWDGKMSLRDNPEFFLSQNKNENISIPELKVKTTKDIIRSIASGTMKGQVMLTIHPQRWNDKPLAWIKELVMQKVKNQVKRVLIMRGGF